MQVEPLTQVPLPVQLIPPHCIYLAIEPLAPVPVAPALEETVVEVVCVRVIVAVV